MPNQVTAHFGADATQLSAPQGAGATPIEGVKEPASQIDLRPISNLFEGIGEVFKNKAKQDAQLMENQVLSQFSSSLSSVDQSWQQHQNPTRYRAERSKIIDQFRTAHPEYTPKFIQVLNMGKEGISGEVEDQEKAQRDRRNSLLKSASDAGILPPGVGRDVEDEVIRAMQTGERMKAQQKEMRDNIEWTQKQDEATRRAAQERLKDDTKGLVTEFSGVHASAFNTSMFDLVKQVNSGKMTPEEAMYHAAGYFNKIQMELSAMSLVDPAIAAPFKDNFNRIWETYKDNFKPGADLNALKTQWEKINISSKLQIAQRDPQMIELSNLSQMLGNQPALYQSVHGTVSKYLISRGLIENGRMNPTIDSNSKTQIIGNSEFEKQAYSTVAKAVSSYKEAGTGKEKETARKEVYGQLSGLVSQYVDAYQLNKLTRDSRKKMSEFLLNKGVAQFLKENPLPLPLARGLASVVDENFKQYKNTVAEALGDVVMGPKIDDKLHGRGMSGYKAKRGASIDPLDAVDISWDNSGIKFTPTSMPADPVDRNRLISRLNEVSVALTNGVKIGAHVEGTDDYAAYFEKVKHRLFEGKFPEPKQSGSQTPVKFSQERDLPNAVSATPAEQKVGPDGNERVRMKDNILSIRNELKKAKDPAAIRVLLDELDKELEGYRNAP